MEKLTASEENFLDLIANPDRNCDIEKDTNNGENKSCLEEKGIKKRLLILITLLFLGIGALFVVSLVQIDPCKDSSCQNGNM